MITETICSPSLFPVPKILIGRLPGLSFMKEKGIYNQQQNKCYPNPKDIWLPEKPQLTTAFCNEIWPQ